MPSPQTQKMLDAYMQAELDLLAGKETSINGRRLALEDLDKIRKGRWEWERRAAAEDGAQKGGLRFVTGRFRRGC